MGQTARITSLRGKHQNLDVKIEDEEKKPHPDDVIIHELKKQKLRIKDELIHLGAD